MPSIPTQTKCAELGCKNVRANTYLYCVEHGGVANALTDERRNANAKYNTSAWNSIRRRQLSMQPLCQACLLSGHVCMANHVDHVFSWRGLDPKAFIYNIFQSLCHEHHSFKTGLERKGIYRHFTKDRVIDYNLSEWASTLSITDHASTSIY